jgi:hypothetical protein
MREARGGRRGWSGVQRTGIHLQLPPSALRKKFLCNEEVSQWLDRQVSPLRPAQVEGISASTVESMIVGDASPAPAAASEGRPPSPRLRPDSLRLEDLRAAADASGTERPGEAGASGASLSEQPEGTAAKRRLRAPKKWRRRELHLFSGSFKTGENARVSGQTADARRFRRLHRFRSVPP